MSLVERPYARKADEMITLTSNTYPRYELGIKAIPGHVDLPNRQRKKGLQKLSELLAKTKPVLAGMVLFHLSYNCYLNRLSSVNKKWVLVPLAHIINWLIVADGKATADFQNSRGSRKLWTRLAQLWTQDRRIPAPDVSTHVVSCQGCFGFPE